MTNFNTPILFLTFNRPDTSKKVFDVLKRLQPSVLYLASDGPRANNENDKIFVKQTRDIFDEIDWKCDVHKLFRKQNLGCRASVSSSIDWFFENVEQGIILEDDCYPDLSFFHFCEEMLVKYANDSRVFHISGTNFLFEQSKIIDNSYYFSRYPLIWGWATWRRAWKNYSINMDDFPVFEKCGTIRSVLGTSTEQQHSLNNFRRMFNHKFNTWDTQWNFAVMKSNGLAVTPCKNLVINIGTQGDSTHKFLKDSKRTTEILQAISFPLTHPPFLINSKADHITYLNAWSKSPRRILRLIKENGIITLIRHFITRFLKNK